MTEGAVVIEQVGWGALPSHTLALGAMLAATVNDGGAVGFVQPFSATDGEHFFTNTIAPQILSGERALITPAPLAAR